MQHINQNKIFNGITAHKEGDFQEAERVYLSILQEHPNHPDANHNLGVLNISLNDADKAIPLFKTAIKSNPNIEQFWLSYIDALLKLEKYDEVKKAILQGKKNGLTIAKAVTFENNLNQKILLKNHKSKTPSQQQLEKLLNLFESNKFEEAEELALLLTSHFPEHQFAWKVLGILYQRSGRISDSIIVSKLSLKLNPNDAQAYYNLGNVLSIDKRLDESKVCFQKAIELDNNHILSYFNLANTFKELGNLDDSESYYRKAIEKKYDYAEAHNNLGTILQQRQSLKEAEYHYQKAIMFNSSFAEACYNLSNIYKDQGKLEEAEASYKKAITIKPDYVEAYNNLGIILQLLTKFDEAEIVLKQAININPYYAEAYYNMGNISQELGKLEKAETNLRKCISLNIKFAEAHNNLGGVLQELGKLEEAQNCYEQAVLLKPDYTEAHRNLTLMKKFKKRDDHFLQMQVLLSNNNLTNEQSSNINFGLAKACEDLGEFEQAFGYYSKGNALRKKNLNYHISKDINLFKQLKISYSNISKISLGSKNFNNEFTPIFIIGMPRSGTTLIEQIVSSHSKVTGAGELPYAARFGYFIVRDLSEINANTLTEFRENYLSKLKSLSEGNKIVIDKMPQNFRYLGLLSSVFPEAKIIHVNRDPMATCWGNYKQYFVAKSIGYCYDLDDVVKYYKLYKDLMKYWSKTLSSKIYDLDYDLLTINQENETRKLISYLNLDWEDNCLFPQNNKRSVATASSRQVREKVYQGSSQKWKKFQPFLNSAFDNLN